MPTLVFHYLFNVIVFQFRVVSLEYFMDKCTLWEINDIIDNIPYMDRNLWESQRLIAYIDAKSHFKGVKSMDDICKLEWDKSEKNPVEEHIIEITNDEIAQLKEISKQWEK